MALALSACAPISVPAAEESCREEAALAASPRGMAQIGLGSGGHMTTRVGINISADYLARRDPAEVWASCVTRRSGQAPVRNYHSLPAVQGGALPMRRG